MKQKSGVTKANAIIILVLGLLWAATLACGLGSAKPTGTPPVVQMMPDLAGYKIVEGQKVQDYIANLAEGASLLAANPQMLLLIEKVDGVIDCYQDAGAAKLRIYTDEAFPLSSGAIAIADRNRLMDPATLFQCAGRRLAPFSAQPTLEPCAHSYTLQRDDNEFYIIFVGTTQEICQAFCDNLEGCTAR